MKKKFSLSINCSQMKKFNKLMIFKVTFCIFFNNIRFLFSRWTDIIVYSGSTLAPPPPGSKSTDACSCRKVKRSVLQLHALCSIDLSEPVFVGCVHTIIIRFSIHLCIVCLFRGKVEEGESVDKKEFWINRV